jgi:predicted AlkP superfamily phosphohydrolase/phosphomutase
MTRNAIAGAADRGFAHIVLALPAPYPDRVVRWLTNTLITPVVDGLAR